MLLMQKDSTISFRDPHTFIEEKKLNFVTSSITCAAYSDKYDFYAGTDQHDIQNIKIESISLTKSKNQLFNFHKAKIIQIIIEKNIKKTDAIYMLSLDTTNKIALWNTERSILGPFFTFSFKAKIQKILKIYGLFQNTFKNVYLLLETEKGVERTFRGDMIPEYSIIQTKKFQQRWRFLSRKWLKLWNSFMKGKKSPYSVNIDFVKFVYKNLIKMKLLKNFKSKGGSSTAAFTPLFFKRYFGYEVATYFTVRLSLILGLFSD